MDNAHAVLSDYDTMDDMDEIKHHTHNVQAESTELQDVRLFNEINLLRLEGFYFCLDPKEAARRTNVKYEFLEIIKRPKTEIAKRPVIIIPNTRYGYPSVLAYKVLQAIMQKLSWFSYPVPDTVTFSQRELARLVGRNSFGGANQQEFYNAIRQLSTTEAAYWFYTKVTDEWTHQNIRILITDIWSGRQDQITRCSVQLHPSIVESLNNRHAMCVNYARMEQLSPVGIALFKRIFFHLSNLYSLKRAKNFEYTKSYESVCTTWLGGLKVLRYKSDIMRDQLGRHLAALTQTTLISNYEIEKNSRGDGFNLVVRPGEGFFQDYDNFYVKHWEIERDYHKAEARKRDELPQQLVEKFYQNLYHQGDLSGMMILDKDIEFAKTLLAKHTHEEVSDLILYTIAAARQKKVDMRSFGGVKMFMNAWLDEKATKAKRAAMELRESARQRDQRIRDQYDFWWRDEVKRLRDATSPDEIAALDTQATKKLLADNQDPNGFGFDFLVRRGVDALLATRYRVPEFDEWRAARKAKVA